MALVVNGQKYGVLSQEVEESRRTQRGGGVHIFELEVEIDAELTTNPDVEMGETYEVTTEDGVFTDMKVVALNGPSVKFWKHIREGT